MSEKIKTIIVEDELPARNLIKSFLKDVEKIEVIAECENGFEGVKMINELKPDLVFLDIRMPKITGFEMLELLDHKPAIIFTTAYDQYALKAFDYNASDYLLKPFSRERMMEAVNKVAERILSDNNSTHKIERFKEFRHPEFLDRIVVKDRNRINIIPVDQILYIDSMDDYVMIYTEKGRYIKQKTMRYLEGALNPKNFVRIHRSYIVRIEEIKEIQQYEKESYIVILNNKAKLKVSKSGYKKLKEVLNF